MVKQPALYDVHIIKDLRDMLKKSVKKYADKTAFILKDNNGNYQNISFIDFQNHVNALGTALIDLGLKDKNIALLGENRYEWCLSYLATVNGTGVIVPLDKELPQNEIMNLLERANVSAVICSAKQLASIKDICPHLPNLKYIISMDSNQQSDYELHSLIKKGEELLESGDKRFLDTELDTEKMNMLLFTSGTTDKSKGVMLSHKNISADIMAVSKCLYADNSDLILSILPLHHTYECTAGFLTMLYLGVKIAFCEGLRHISKNMQEYNPSIIMSVPLILENIYDKIVKKAKKSKKYSKLLFAMFMSNRLFKLGIDKRKNIFKDVHTSLGGNMRLVISGAAALNPKVSKSLRAMGLNIMQGYGLTECSPIVSVNRISYYNDSSSGIPLPGVDVRIENPDSNGIGEILIKSDTVFLGYFNDENATNQVLKDGWFYSGDYGYINKKGFLHISGRKKNVIVTKNGKNIFPEDVELYLNKSVFIQESLVYGIDDEDKNETIVCAQIVPNYEIINDHFGKEPTEQDINELIKLEVKKTNKKLTSYKKVKHFEIRKDEFEKTTTKKIKRYVEMLSLKNLNLNINIKNIKINIGNKDK